MLLIVLSLGSKEREIRSAISPRDCKENYPWAGMYWLPNFLPHYCWYNNCNLLACNEGVFFGEQLSWHILIRWPLASVRNSCRSSRLGNLGRSVWRRSEAEWCFYSLTSILSHPLPSIQHGSPFIQSQINSQHSHIICESKCYELRTIL